MTNTYKTPDIIVIDFDNATAEKMTAEAFIDKYAETCTTTTGTVPVYEYNPETKGIIDNSYEQPRTVLKNVPPWLAKNMLLEWALMDVYNDTESGTFNKRGFKDKAGALEYLGDEIGLMVAEGNYKKARELQELDKFIYENF